MFYQNVYLTLHPNSEKGDQQKPFVPPKKTGFSDVTPFCSNRFTTSSQATLVVLQKEIHPFLKSNKTQFTLSPSKTGYQDFTPFLKKLRNQIMSIGSCYDFRHPKKKQETFILRFLALCLRKGKQKISLVTGVLIFIPPSKISFQPDFRKSDIEHSVSQRFF